MGISLSGSSGNSLHASASRWRPSSVRSSSEQGEEKMWSVPTGISERCECCIWLICLSAVTGTSSWALPNVAGTCCPTPVTAERMTTSPSTLITCTGGSSTSTAASNRYIYVPIWIIVLSQFVWMGAHPLNQFWLVEILKDLSLLPFYFLNICSCLVQICNEHNCMLTLKCMCLLSQMTTRVWVL